MAQSPLYSANNPVLCIFCNQCEPEIAKVFPLPAENGKVRWALPDGDKAAFLGDSVVVINGLDHAGAHEQLVLVVQDLQIEGSGPTLSVHGLLKTRLHSEAAGVQLHAWLDLDANARNLRGAENFCDDEVALSRIWLGNNPKAGGGQFVNSQASSAEVCRLIDAVRRLTDPKRSALTIDAGYDSIDAASWRNRGLDGVTRRNLWFSSESTLMVKPRAIEPGVIPELWQCKQAANANTLQYEQETAPIQDGVAIVSGTEAPSDPLHAARIPISKYPVRLRSSINFSGKGQPQSVDISIEWIYECLFTCVDPQSPAFDPLEVWNDRIVNDLLRSMRVSFLPFFVRYLEPSGNPRGDNWRLIIFEPDTHSSLRNSSDGRFLRVLEPENTITCKAELQGAAFGLPVNQLPTMIVELEPFAEPVESWLSGTKDNSVKNAFTDNGLDLLREAARTHGVLLFNITPISQPSKVAVDGVEFGLSADPIEPTRACAWMSLAGRFAVESALPENKAGAHRRPRWEPSLSHYQIANLYLFVDGFRPLDSSARAEASRTQSASLPSDLTRGIRRESRGIVSLLGTNAGNIASTLVVNEFSRRRGGVDLDCKWQRRSVARSAQTSESISVLLLQFQPLLVARLDVDMGGQDLSTEQELGAYNGKVWLFKGARDFFAVLPPSCTGEQAIRGSRLDPDDGKPSRFRFSPPTVLSLRSQDDPVSYATAPWLLASMFNGGEDNLDNGVTLRTLSAELLYGLPMRVWREGLRIASVFRRRGWPIDPRKLNVVDRAEFAPHESRAAGSTNSTSAYPAQTLAAFDNPFDDWKRAAMIVRSSISAVELFDAAAPRDEPLKIDRSVSWALRRSARLANPFMLETPTDLFDREARLVNPEGDPLWGGVTIGFESNGVLQEFKDRAPSGSTGGHVSGLFLSAHGATASFRSEFEDGLLTIECTIEQGVVTRYVVSRKGRIGCLWNHSRHVVVYERTAIFNPRYTERTDERKQKQQKGRAFLRKVDEYVEVLEVRRSYPDLGNADRLNACIAGSDFGVGESALFRVEASWARDIFNDNGDIVGWAIPLWLPLEQQKSFGGTDNNSPDPSRSGLHPKPAISLMTHTNRADGLADHQMIEDPHKLMFYTRVFGTGEQIQADTDRWPAVVDVDYCDLPCPEPSRKRALKISQSAEEMDGRPDDPDDPEIEPGFEPFTLTLAPGPRPVNLMQGRRGEPLIGEIRTALMTRAHLRSLNDAPAALQESVKSLRNVSQFLGGVNLDLPDSPLGHLITAVQDGTSLTKVQDLLDKLEEPIKSLNTLASDLHRDGIASFKEVYKKTGLVETTRESARQNLASRLDRFQKVLNKSEPDVEHWIDQALMQAWPMTVVFDRLSTILLRAEAATTTGLKAARQKLGALVEGEGRLLDGIIEARKRCLDACKASADKNQILDLIDTEIARLEGALAISRRGFDAARTEAKRACNDQQSRLPAIGPLTSLLDALVDGVADRCAHLLSVLDTKAQHIHKDWEIQRQKLREAPDLTQKCSEACVQFDRLVLTPLEHEVLALRATIDSGLEQFEKPATGEFLKFREAVHAERLKIRDGLKNEFRGIYILLKQEFANAGPAFPESWLSKLECAKMLLENAVDQKQKSPPESTEPSECNKIVSLQTAISECAEKVTRAVREYLAERLRGLRGGVDVVRKEIEDFLKKQTAVADLEKLLRGNLPIERLVNQADLVQERWNNTRSEIENTITQLTAKAITAADAARQIREHAVASASSIRDAGRAYAETASRAARAISKGDIFAIAESGLSLQRAFGEPPRVPGLEFNRKQIAYHFDRLSAAIRTTPMGVLLDRAGEHLKGISLRFPTDTFEDAFLPALREHIDLGQLIPDIGGLKLSDLFPGVDLSRLNNEYIRIKHEFDPKTRTAAVFADVDYPLAGDSPLVTGDILSITLRGARLRARTRVESRDGVVRRETQGSLSADWIVKLAGGDFVEFSDTTLRFDPNGKTTFNLRPEKMKLRGLLGFISEKLRTVDPDNDSTHYIQGPLGLPRGVEINIDLSIPDVQGGTTGFSGLRLGAVFRLALGEITDLSDPQSIKRALSEFEVGVGFSLAKPDRPFMISAFILGGAGHLDVGLRYQPIVRRTRAYIDVSMNASASLAFSVAGVSGGVYAFLGIVFRYEGGTGLTPQLVFSARLLISGEVDVWGIVSASISIELRLAYLAARQQLVAAGRLRIRIKICWCFTIKISIGFTIPSGVSDAELGMQALALPRVPGGTRDLALLGDSLLRAAALAV